jgi:hypothetical protein
MERRDYIIHMTNVAYIIHLISIVHRQNINMKKALEIQRFRLLTESRFGE